MFSDRFRALVMRHLHVVLAALAEPRHAVLAAVAAVRQEIAARGRRLEELIRRFEAGKLRTRPFRRRPGAVSGRQPRAFAARLEKPWPEHVANWLHLMGHNHPSALVRHGWHRPWPPPVTGEMRKFETGFAALVEEPGMREFLAASREGRRLARWFLHMTGADLTEAVREPKRPKRPHTRRRRPDPWRRPASARPPRPPHPWTVPPDNLGYEERVARGLPVPPPIQIMDPSMEPITPDRVQLERRRVVYV